MNPLWEQFELHYVRRRPPFRAWKRWLSVGCALLAAAWALAAGVRRDSTMFSSGPMSRGHAHLANNCAACHSDSWRTLADLIPSATNAHAMNAACLRCHGRSIGHDPRTANAWHQSHGDPREPEEPTLACYACHAEHEGPVALRDVPDADCLRCHADLSAHRPASATTAEARATFVPAITSFAGDHPEFEVIAENRPDEGRMLLNHAKHLDPSAFPDRTQMECHHCHRAGRSASPWPFGAPRTHEDALVTKATLEPELQAAYMDPIRYSLHCKNCHELSVDGVRKRLKGTGVVPHDSPAVIRTFLWGALTQHVDAHPEELEESADTADPRHAPFGGPRRKAEDEIDRRKVEWVRTEQRILEDQLFDTKLFCRKCHEVDAAPDEIGLPVILAPNIPARWFGHASFNHERHRTMKCDECHPRAKESKETKDVLLPGIDVCRKCHAPAGTSPTSGASDRCVLCHTYHVPNGGAVADSGVTVP